MDILIFAAILSVSLWVALNVNFYREAQCYDESVSMLIRSRNLEQVERLKRFIFYMPALIYDAIFNKDL